MNVFLALASLMGDEMRPSEMPWRISLIRRPYIWSIKGFVLGPPQNVALEGFSLVQMQLGLINKGQLVSPVLQA
jgi:hypothetical protein